MNETKAILEGDILFARSHRSRGKMIGQLQRRLDHLSEAKSLNTYAEQEKQALAWGIPILTEVYRQTKQRSVPRE